MTVKVIRSMSTLLPGTTYRARLDGPYPPSKWFVARHHRDAVKQHVENCVAIGLIPTRHPNEVVVHAHNGDMTVLTFTARVIPHGATYKLELSI